MGFIERGTDLDSFVGIVGKQAWQARIDAIIQAQATPGQSNLCGRDVLRRHAIEIAIERQRRPSANHPSLCDARMGRLAAEAVRLHGSLSPEGRRRFEARLDHAMLDGQSLTPLFHMLRTAWLHRRRGFDVTFAGLADGASFDLALRRDDVVAEVACEVVSAEAGRGLHRGAWFRLVDLIDADLGAWLDHHPGRYLLKMTLPDGLRVEPAPAGAGSLACLRARITAMLTERRRADQDQSAIMRLDPFSLSAMPTREQPIMAHLQSMFSPETHLAVRVKGEAVFAMAAHAGRENNVPLILRRRMADIAPNRLSGACPGILAMYVEDTELREWRGLTRDMSLEAETRQFLTTPEARHVVSVACTSRHELFDPARDDVELRFRNPGHGAAKVEALAPSITSSN